MVQNNLGTALQEKAARANRAEITMLLTQAIAAYRAALEVYTRDTMPQAWAITQNNLGNALLNQGQLVIDGDGVVYWTQAVKAYYAALEVRTQETLPKQWAETQYNLGKALLAKGELIEAAACFENVLLIDQDDQHVKGLNESPFFRIRSCRFLFYKPKANLARCDIPVCR